MLNSSFRRRTIVSSSIASTLAAASPAMISRARFGPVSTPGG